MAVIGMGSSGIQVTAEVSSYAERLYTWIRSPTWITAGFAQNHAGPNGANFECTLPNMKLLELEADSLCRQFGSKAKVCARSSFVPPVLQSD